MRLAVPIATLLIAVLSVFLDLFAPAIASPVCLHGGCRFDQMLAAVTAAGATPEAVSVLASADPANPLVWCTYAEVEAAHADDQKAEAAFDHAVSLGPEMPAVMMRVANYDFTHGRREQGLLLAPRILMRTNVFDEILFSYLSSAGAPAHTLLGTAIPVTKRPAQAWLNWLQRHGSDRDIRDTWTWMKGNGLTDEKSARWVAWTLWNRRAYFMAHELWNDWTGTSRLLANARFETEPLETPFDWSIDKNAPATITRKSGIEVRFNGADNVAFWHLRQLTVASPGRYRFSAEVGSEGLTTDQRPFFHIFDSAEPARLSVVTGAVDGTVAKSTISVTFSVSGKPEPLTVELERTPSDHFDNNISGTLHIYGVDLARLDTVPPI